MVFLVISVIYYKLDIVAQPISTVEKRLDLFILFYFMEERNIRDGMVSRKSIFINLISSTRHKK